MSNCEVLGLLNMYLIDGSLLGFLTKTRIVEYPAFQAPDHVPHIVPPPLNNKARSL